MLLIFFIFVSLTLGSSLLRLHTPVFLIKISRHLDNPPVLSDFYAASKDQCP
jgi:hypothetical protein